MRNEKNNFFVRLHEIPYAKERFLKLIQENTELNSVLKNFKSYYFIFDGTLFTLKYSKENCIVFSGSVTDFKDYFKSSFKINLQKKATRIEFESMLFDIQKFKTKKNYKLLTADDKTLSINVEICNNEDKQYAIALILPDEKINLSENIYSQSIDGLTDLLNKKSIIQRAVQKINSEKSTCALVIIDIDKFKDYNDNYGHAYGDQVLIAVSSIIKKAVKNCGIAGRIGGDEFLAIINTNDEEEVRSVTRNIRLGICWGVDSPDPSKLVTCSMGIARFPMNADNYDDIFSLADKCLYIAKNKGRNCYVIYKPEIHDKIIVRNEEENLIKATGKTYSDDAENQLEIINLMSDFNESKIQKMLDKMLAYMNINQITVYKADEDNNLRPAYFSGGNLEFREKHFNPTYCKNFNSFSFLHLDNTTSLDTVDKKSHAMYADNQVGSVIEYCFKNKNKKPNALVCYDLYKPSRAFDKEKVVFAITFAKFLTKNL